MQTWRLKGALRGDFADSLPSPTVPPPPQEAEPTPSATPVPALAPASAPASAPVLALALAPAPEPAAAEPAAVTFGKMAAEQVAQISRQDHAEIAWMSPADVGIFVESWQNLDGFRRDSVEILRRRSRRDCALARQCAGESPLTTSHPDSPPLAAYSLLPTSPRWLSSTYFLDVQRQ